MVVCSSLISHALPETGRAAYAQDGARGPEHSRTLPGLRSCASVSVVIRVRGSVRFPWIVSASARTSTRREVLEARCPTIQHHYPTA